MRFGNRDCQMPTTRELTAILVKMKARLAFGRQGGAVAVLNAAGLLVGAVGTAVTVGFIFMTRDARDNATQVMLILAGISIAWLVLSIVVGSGENILDPSKFAIFPVSTRQLTVAFLAASFVGVLAPGTAIVALSTTLHAPDVFAVGVLVLGSIVVTAVSVLSGRLGLALMSSLVRGRGTRELAAIFAGLFAVLAGLAPQFAIELADQFTEERRATARMVLRWVPWGWAPEGIASAIEGRIGRALLFVALGAVLAFALGEAWRRLMTTILTTRPAASEATSIAGGLVPRLLRPFGRSVVVAATARALRQLRRDPREFLEIAAFLPIVLVTALPALEALRAGEPEVVLSTVGVGVGLGITTLNMFGADGRSFGVDALALGDVTPILFGKALSRVLIGLPLVFLAALVLAVLSGGWAFVLPGVLIALTALLVMATVGMQVSVRFPFPLPERAGAVGSGANGCAMGVIRGVSVIIALVFAGLGTVPVGLISVFVSPLVGALAGLVSLAYGLAVFWFGGRHAGRRATTGIPELYQTLSTPAS